MYKFKCRNESEPYLCRFDLVGAEQVFHLVRFVFRIWWVGSSKWESMATCWLLKKLWPTNYKICFSFTGDVQSWGTCWWRLAPDRFDIGTLLCSISLSGMIDLVGQLTRFDFGGRKSFPKIGPWGGCDTNWTRHQDRWESIHVSITPLVIEWGCWQLSPPWPFRLWKSRWLR